MNGKIFDKSRLMFVSPWLLAAAVALLLVIILVFAANNLQRGKLLLTERLFHKGLDTARFVGAGMRASVMMGVPGSTQVQHLIEQATLEGEDLLYIVVLDSKFRILAHSSKELVGAEIENPGELASVYKQTPTWRTITDENSGKNIFEVIAPFQPFPKGRGRFMRNRMQKMMNQQAAQGVPNGGDTQNDWCRIYQNNDEPLTRDKSPIILVGLNTYDLDALNRQNRINIYVMSTALLFIGLGGWIALLAAQGFRASQTTIQRMQAFTNLLISRLPVGIIATGKNGLIQTFNNAAAEMTGTEDTNIINRTPTEALPDEFAAFFKTGQVDTEVQEREINFERDDKKPSSFHVSSAPILDEHNILSGRVLLMHDLTRLKELEKDVRRHEQLAALGKMAAGVAHEVRNPLSSIKGFATLLGSRFNKESKEYATASLMINEVERLNRSITELLNYARPLPLNLSEFSADDAIANSLKLIESDAKALGVDLGYETAPNCPQIYADQDRMNQVLLNLYLNALQAMAETGGRLHVSVQSGKTNDAVMITVTDSGKGIPAEMLSHILEPYFTTRPGGTGLGLAMVHKIIDDHGGQLEITSEEGKGTSVTITLPLRKEND